jgi:hypothetical protein
MDASTLTGFVGLAGAAIGGLTSFATSWFTQNTQRGDKRRESEQARRIELYGAFIAEASRLYADALSHSKDDVTELVSAFALVGRIRLFSSQPVIDAAERALSAIADTYMAPNMTLHQLHAHMLQGGLDPMLDFSSACRAELEKI